MIVIQQVEVPLGKQLRSRHVTPLSRLLCQLIRLPSQRLNFGAQLRQFSRSILRRRPAVGFCLNHQIGEALVFRREFGKLVIEQGRLGREATEKKSGRGSKESAGCYDLGKAEAVKKAVDALAVALALGAGASRREAVVATSAVLLGLLLRWAAARRAEERS